MKKILILMGRYLPGYKDGGPVRTIINLTEALGDEYEFYILTLDRDHGDIRPYDNIKYDEWLNVGKAKVQYVKPKGFTFKLIRKLISECDLVYTCGFYDDYGYKTLMLKQFKKVYGKPVVVASMGSFSKGALSQKSLKKKIFINTFKFLGLFNNIVWSVTSELEANDLKKTIGTKAMYIVAEDLPRSVVPGRSTNSKVENSLNVVFLSRISPKKNLIGAIKILTKVSANIKFTICGPDEDKEYFKECKYALPSLPSNVKWEYKGNILSDEVQVELAQHDVFLFPTLGENYGHVIFEALSVGCIPVISDTTPWKDLDSSGCGFVLSLDDLSAVSALLDKLANMDSDDFSKYSLNAVNYATEKTKNAVLNTGYRNIFDLAGKEDL